MTQATVRDNKVLQRYEIVAEEELEGYLEYQRLGDELVIVHAAVFPGALGLGYASELIKSVLDDARREKTPVVVVCPFVTQWLTRHPEYHDVEVRSL